MRNVLYVLLAASLIVVVYMYINRTKAPHGEVVESMQLCDPKEVTKMPETFN